MTQIGEAMVGAGLATKPSTEAQERPQQTRFITDVRIDRVISTGDVNKFDRPVSYGFGTVVGFIQLDPKGAPDDDGARPEADEAVYISPFTNDGVLTKGETLVVGIVIRVSVQRQTNKDANQDWTSGWFHRIITRPDAEQVATIKVDTYVDNLVAQARAVLQAWITLDPDQTDKQGKDLKSAIIAGFQNNKPDTVKSSVGALKARVEEIEIKKVRPELQAKAMLTAGSELFAEFGNPAAKTATA